MKVEVGEINTRVLMQMAWNDKEKMMDEVCEQEQKEPYKSPKNLNSLTWDIYNMSQALVSVVEVYPEFEEEINRFFQSMLDTVTVRIKHVASRLPYTIDR